MASAARARRTWGWRALGQTVKAVRLCVSATAADDVLHRLDLARGQDRRLGRLEKYAGALTVSPDGRTILHQKVARDGADLMLIENFR